MAKIHIQTGPITNTIYAGTVANGGQFLNKQDVTEDALFAVARLALEFGAPVILSNENGPLYRITVEDLTEKPLNDAQTLT